MTFSRHTSNATASGTVYGIEAITAAARAHDAQGDRRMDLLLDAQECATKFLADIQDAISAEIAARPAAARLVTERAMDKSELAESIEDIR